VGIVCCDWGNWNHVIFVAARFFPHFSVGNFDPWEAIFMEGPLERFAFEALRTWQE
jgi:hypothetical protein